MTVRIKEGLIRQLNTHMDVDMYGMSMPPADMLFCDHSCNTPTHESYWAFNGRVRFMRSGYLIPDPFFTEGSGKVWDYDSKPYV